MLRWEMQVVPARRGPSVMVPAFVVVVLGATFTYVSAKPLHDVVTEVPAPSVPVIRMLPPAGTANAPAPDPAPSSVPCVKVTLPPTTVPCTGTTSLDAPCTNVAGLLSTVNVPPPLRSTVP